MGKKVCIFEMIPETFSTTIAHIRIARFLRDVITDSVIVSTPETVTQHIKEKFDVVIFMYAAKSFNGGKPFEYVSRFLDEQKDAKFFWCINEYGMNPNSFVSKIFKEKGFGVLANFDRNTFKINNTSIADYIDDYHLINLNVTAYRFNAITRKERKYDLIYYGTFRPDRAKYFAKYLNNAIVSTSIKNIPKYKSVCKPNGFIGKLDWDDGRSLLRLFEYSLYIEDSFTHANYNHLADRFYEALSYDVVTLFDKSCDNTISRSKYPIELLTVIDEYQPGRYDFDRLRENNEKLREIFLNEWREVRDKISAIFNL